MSRISRGASRYPHIFEVLALRTLSQTIATQQQAAIRAMIAPNAVGDAISEVALITQRRGQAPDEGGEDWHDGAGHRQFRKHPNHLRSAIPVYRDQYDRLGLCGGLVFIESLRQKRRMRRC